MKKIAALFLSALLANVVCAADPTVITTAPVTTHKSDEIVARVGKTEIKWGQVEPAVTAFIKQFSMRGRVFPQEQLGRLSYDVLNEIATRELVLQQATANEPTNIAVRVKEQIEQSKLQAGSEENYTKALAENGITPDEYAKRIHETLLIQETIKKVVEDKVKITDDDCKKFHDENRSKFIVPEQMRANHILILCPPDATAEVRTQKLAQIQAALSLVKGGEKFTDVARKFSEDTGSKEQGGDLGFFPRGRMVPEFETAAFGLATNQISDVVTTPYGYHVIKAIERTPAGERTYAETKENIASYLKNLQGEQVVKQYLKDLRNKTKVEILLPEPPPLAMPPTMPLPDK
ncbi:MAG: peptidylprolyl isomerase [Verrucomicrobiota bacterium]